MECGDKLFLNTGLAFVIGSVVETARIAKDATSLRVIYPAPIMAEFAKNVGTKSLQFALVGAVYTGGACLSAGVRGKDDALNYGVGGALVGALYGLRVKRFQSAVYGGIILGAAGIFCATSEKLMQRTWSSDSMSRERHTNAFMMSQQDKVA